MKMHIIIARQHGRNLANLLVLTNQPKKNSVTSKLSFSYWNAGSVKNKATGISDYVYSNDIDIIAITETWLYHEEKRKCCVYQ